MPQFYVYVYRDPSRDNEPIYCGKGQGDRAYEHLKYARNPHLRNRLAKMKREGVDPIINVVDLPSEALAIQCEIDTIARFGRKDLKLGPLLNQTDGGEGQSNPSLETRKKMSDARKGEKSYWFGKSHSDISKQKMSDAQKGNKGNNFGKSAPASVKAKQSAALKGKYTGENNHMFGKVHRKLICPHCAKEASVNMAYRWHFDNCKYKKHLEE